MEDLLEEIGQELTPHDARETRVTLNKILGNIVQNPTEAKFRNLKKDNKTISEKILRSGAATSLLLAVGFDDTGAAYSCAPDTDLEPMRTAVDLLECLIVSTEDVVAPAKAEQAATPQPCSGYNAPELVPVPAATPATMNTKTVENPHAFKRLSEEEKKRQEQANQLQAARAARNAQYVENPSGPTYIPPAAPAVQAVQTENASAKKTAKPTAFDFQDRHKKEQERAKADENLQDIRKLQKDKFKDFQADPNAKKQEAYKAPPAVAGNAKADDSWGGWFGGMFGGGSSSGGSTQQKPERRGPNIKGVGDLPKPVQRG
jgi:hypothetical protein